MRSPRTGLTLALAASVCALAACRTNGGATVKDETPVTPPPGDQAPGDQPPAAGAFDTPASVPAPFAKGTSDGLFWEARFNFPPCDHPGKKKGAWCDKSDQSAAAAQSGVEAEIKAWANDPKVKSVQLAFFSFSNAAIIKTLCDTANARDIPITVFIHKENLSTPGVKQLATCSPSKLTVVARGTEFGSGYLQHAKIVLASEVSDPLPTHLMPTDSQAAAGDTVTRWTSGSANMSSFGTSLHIDNWIFFTAQTKEYLAQENLCFFHALRTMQNGGDATGDRTDFAAKNKACLAGIKTPFRKNIVFYPVPHAKLTRQIYPEVKKALDGAQSEIKVVIHRLTTGNMYGPLKDAKMRGVDVKLIEDDDTLRTGKCNGGPALDQGAQDVLASRTLRDAGVPVTFLETNGEVGQLAHNKFIVVDDKWLLQGAGNFTATSLNSSGLGNLEDFYVITEPSIVKAYSQAWDYLRSVSTKAEDHEVFANKDKKLKTGGPFGASFDPSGCP